jgi:formyl-CoA transferase
MNLARLGAEVIKAEIPNGGDPVRSNGPFAGPDGVHAVRQSDQDMSTHFLRRNQGVKGITLNLKEPEGRRMFLALAKESDVVLENLAPGSLKQMGLGYSDVCDANPGIVYCSISGYGQDGPNAGRRAHDPQIQGMSGLMEINGDADRPPTKVGFNISDLVTPLFACYSILAALREKERTGKGQYLDASMMDTLVSLMFTENVEDTLVQGWSLRTGNFSRSGPTGLYHAIDGDVTVTAVSDDQWRRLCQALDVPELFEDARFKSYQDRIDHVDSAREAVQASIAKRTQLDALERLEEFGVSCGPVRSLREVMEDEQLWHRGTLHHLRHGALSDPVPGVASGFPVAFSGGLPPAAGAPALGMHNEEIYGGVLGLSQEKLDGLREQGVI